MALGCLFALYIDPIFSFRELLVGGRGLGPFDPRHLQPAGRSLQLADVASAAGLALGLSFTVITIFPARRAARMNPVEALRHE